MYTNVRLVFGCTRDDCREVKDSWPRCRGCFFCVARCETCGGCVDLEELSAILCMDCYLKLPKCTTCNRPYCERHENLQVPLSPSGHFTCHRCKEFGTSLESLEEGYQKRASAPLLSPHVIGYLDVQLLFLYQHLLFMRLIGRTIMVNYLLILSNEVAVDFMDLCNMLSE